MRFALYLPFLLAATSSSAVDFSTEIYPLLQRACFECHGAENDKGGLRLHDAASQAKADHQEILRRVSLPRSDKEAMPKRGGALTEPEIQNLRDWIGAGAVWPETLNPQQHWSYVPPKRPELPAVTFTEEALAHVVQRVGFVQDFLGRQILLENVSSYLTYPTSTMTEWEFLSEIARRADCGILLDVNNVYVSAQNHGFSADAFLNAVPVDRVAQYHLAGHWNRGDILIDTHEGHVSDPVWDLYRKAVRRLGEVPTLIEWDEGVPELDVLLAESAKAARIEAEARGPLGWVAARAGAEAGS